MRAADSSRCFSLVGSPAPGQVIALNLEAATVESRATWLQAVQALLAQTSSRRRIVAADEALGPDAVDADDSRALDPEEEMASLEVLDVLAGGADLSEEERRAILEQSHGNRRRFSVQNTNTAASAALPEIVETQDEEAEAEAEEEK